MIRPRAVFWTAFYFVLLPLMIGQAADDRKGVEFFERRIRPLLVHHCYECHSEEAGEQQGGLLLDRRAGWLAGGDTGKAVVPGEPDASLIIEAVRYANEDLQMPPDGPLDPDQVSLLETWIRRGAIGPAVDLGVTDFSRLGDQPYLFRRAEEHWSFQPVQSTTPPTVTDPLWNRSIIDRFIYSQLQRNNLTPSNLADPRTLIRRLMYDLTGLPPTPAQTKAFLKAFVTDRSTAVSQLIEDLLASAAYGEHFGRMWLDVARYADTDSFYRPDTRTAHYFPFAFTYRDYVVDAFNADKPFDQFVREQLAADLMGFPPDAPELAALGFLTVGPHVNRNEREAIDDWIDVTTRGLLGVTVACARCHDHKFEPIPTSDYYSLHGIFSSIQRPHPLDEARLPRLQGYRPSRRELADYQAKRTEIDAKIEKVAPAEAKKIRETELAELLLFHPGAPVHTMVVQEASRVVDPYVFLRGDPANRGEEVPRRFLKVLDPHQPSFSCDSSGRGELVEKIIDPENPLTARVLVNRVWGFLMGSYLVDTPSDFGLQGSTPTHPELLDWLADDFVRHGWSIKRLVRAIVMSRTYQQSSGHRDSMARIDPTNRQLWRANRQRLSIEAIRDSMLFVSGQLDLTPRGRPQPLWDEGYTRRRAVYGYVNRFNLDPTLRNFDFPNPMQTQPARGESIVAPQSLFVMNAPFVIDQSIAITQLPLFRVCESDQQRINVLFQLIFQRDATRVESDRIRRFATAQHKFLNQRKKGSLIASPWPLVAQALLMSNEFQYID